MICGLNFTHKKADENILATEVDKKTSAYKLMGKLQKLLQ
jgi:hypothetical protein